MTTETIVSITLIIANIITVLTGIVAGARLIWWMSKLDSRVDDAKANAVRAHRRIDDIEKYIHRDHEA